VRTLDRDQDRDRDRDMDNNVCFPAIGTFKGKAKVGPNEVDRDVFLVPATVASGSNDSFLVALVDPGHPIEGIGIDETRNLLVRWDGGSVLRVVTIGPPMGSPFCVIDRDTPDA
jgi:hypothetical protein